MLLTSELQSLASVYKDTFQFVSKNVNRYCIQLSKAIDTAGQSLIKETDDIKNRGITVLPNPENESLQSTQEVWKAWLENAEIEMNDLLKLKSQWLQLSQEQKDGSTTSDDNIPQWIPTVNNNNLTSEQEEFIKNITNISSKASNGVQDTFNLLSIKSDQLLSLLKQITYETEQSRNYQDNITSSININALGSYQTNDAKSLIKKIVKE